MYGDHLIISPWKRWCILITYWGLLAAWVLPQGYGILLWEQDWLPLSPLHAASLIHQVGIFLSLWTYSAYTFGREWSLFSTIVYPIGHILDTLMWAAVFDTAKTYLASTEHSSYVLGEPSEDVYSYWIGHLCLSMVIACHRKTMEVWYLPEHHPPRHVRGNLWYVPAAIGSSFFFTAIYHFYGDLKWCVLLKFIVDFYCCIRMRIQAPWGSYRNEHEKDRKWDWAGF